MNNSQRNPSYYNKPNQGEREDYDNEPYNNKRHFLSHTQNVRLNNQNSQVNSENDIEDNNNNYQPAKSLKNIPREEIERNEKNNFDNLS